MSLAKKKARLKRHRLTTAVLAAVVLPVAGSALAQASNQPTQLDRVTVTGSLIPQTQIETQTPIISISAEDIQARGFTSVADALQQSSLSTGGIQGGQTSASFTQGAEAVSMFGLDPGYTKYLINGRPMLQYPALYNGSDTFNNISGIPIDMVERIEILPGGQSSLYGSDAIAGVINIILKDRLDGGSLSLRGGTFTEGGGSSFRFSAARGFSAFDNRLNALASVQWESRNPIWGYQRDLTDSTNSDGYSPQLPPNNYLVYSAITGDYYMPDPALCANTASQFGGTTVLGTRSAGQSCGSVYTPGYRTLRNGKDSGQIYATATFDVTDNFQLFGNVLYNNEKVEYATGSSYTWWGSSSGFGAIYDPNLDDFIYLQRVFSPEDIGGGGYADTMNTDRNKSYQVSFGGKGSFGKSWDYEIAISRGEYKLDERGFARWADDIDSYFERTVLGPQLGTTTAAEHGYAGYPIYAPDYAAFYSTQLTPADFASFTGYTTSRSRTWQTLTRAQLTNGSLFSLPGGDAGVAFVLEGGSEGWDYSPDERLIDGSVWGTTAVAGAGHRSNYAATTEIRLPLWDQLTVSASGRYDAFKIADNTIDKATYSIGLEFRPIESLLFRGKYGTAFRAPSLSDAFQGVSGYYANGSTDYYRCGELGYTPGNTNDCRYDSVSVYGEQEGNPNLEPITAKVWNAGVVWAPLNTLSLSVDYYNWKIENEVDTISSDQLLLAEYYCRNGMANNTAASCSNVNDWVTRDAAGALISIYTPKVNIAKQNLEAVTASFKYLQDIGRFGSLTLSGNYTNMISREVQPQPGDEYIDLLRDPYNMWLYDAYAKVRSDGSLAWAIDKWTTTLYANYIGKTPNYLAYALYGYGQTNSYGAKSGKWGSYTTYNLSVNYRVMDNLQLSLLVNNVFNKMPDGQARNYPGTSSTPFNNYLYNVYGRAVYLEARYTF